MYRSQGRSLSCMSGNAFDPPGNVIAEHQEGQADPVEKSNPETVFGRIIHRCMPTCPIPPRHVCMLLTRICGCKTDLQPVDTDTGPRPEDSAQGEAEPFSPWALGCSGDPDPSPICAPACFRRQHKPEDWSQLKTADAHLTFPTASSLPLQQGHRHRHHEFFLQASRGSSDSARGVQLAVSFDLGGKTDSQGVLLQCRCV